VDSDASLSEVLSLCAEEHVSRLPVVEDGTVVGTVELRDAVRVSEEGGELADAVVEPLRVGGSLPVDDLLLRSAATASVSRLSKIRRGRVRGCHSRRSGRRNRR